MRIWNKIKKFWVEIIMQQLENLIKKFFEIKTVLCFHEMCIRDSFSLVLWHSTHTTLTAYWSTSTVNKKSNLITWILDYHSTLIHSTLLQKALTLLILLQNFYLRETGFLHLSTHTRINITYYWELRFLIF